MILGSCREPKLPGSQGPREPSCGPPLEGNPNHFFPEPLLPPLSPSLRLFSDTWHVHYFAGASVRPFCDPQAVAMAPITDDTVDALRDTIRKLESRVHQLESRLGEGHGGSSANDRTMESIRMILMGPPGAGMIEGTGKLMNADADQPCQERERKLQRSKTNTAHVIW